MGTGAVEGDEWEASHPEGNLRKDRGYMTGNPYVSGNKVLQSEKDIISALALSLERKVMVIIGEL